MSGFTSLGKKGSGGAGGGGAGGAGAVGPFGSALTSDLTPSGQGIFTYTINPAIWTTSSNGSGASVTLDSSNNVVVCSSGTSTSGSAGVRLARGVKYRAGQGSVCRLTAIFGDGVSGSYQLAGVGNNECGYYFAMSGSNFGILHRERSKLEIRSFTITTGVATSTNVTVNLGGYSKIVSIAGGSNIYQTAHELSRADYSDVDGGWTAESHGATVMFRRIQPGPSNGTYTLSGGTIAYTAAQIQAGINPTETFISQSAWNIDPLDGSGPSRFTLDRTKGNVYSVGYQYLGFGDPTFSVEDPETGTFTYCHRIQTANSRTSTVLKNPHMFAGWQADNVGSSTSVTVKGASAGTFTEGLVNRNIGASFSYAVTKASLSDGVAVPAVTIRADQVYNSMACYGEIDVFNISIGTDTGSAASIRLLQVSVYKNATLTGPVNFQYIDSSSSLCSYDTSATGFSGGQLVKAFLVAANSSVTLSLQAENFYLSNGEKMTIVVKPLTGNISTAAGSISWFEDQ